MFFFVLIISYTSFSLLWLLILYSLFTMFNYLVYGLFFSLNVNRFWNDGFNHSNEHTCIIMWFYILACVVVEPYVVLTKHVYRVKCVNLFLLCLYAHPVMLLLIIWIKPSAAIWFLRSHWSLQQWQSMHSSLQITLSGLQPCRLTCEQRDFLSFFQEAELRHGDGSKKCQ